MKNVKLSFFFLSTLVVVAVREVATYKVTDAELKPCTPVKGVLQFRKK